MKDSFTTEEHLILERFSCDPAYAKHLIRIGRARKEGKDLTVQMHHVDKYDIKNYTNIKEELNKCRKTINKLNARLNCIIENNAFSSLPYSQIKDILLKITNELNATITDNIDPNLKAQEDRLFLVD